MTESELRTLPRKLAERLISETDNFGDCSLTSAIAKSIAIAKAEAVILEAIEQTLAVAILRLIKEADRQEQEFREEAAREEAKYGETIRRSELASISYEAQKAALWLRGNAAAIRSLKPAKSEEVA